MLCSGNDALIAKHLRISGWVQGVGYRDWLVTRARGLGLSGWVRNRSDGSVEALIGGDASGENPTLGALFLRRPIFRLGF